ncbi:hypothetical protein L9Y56_003626 [Klebsiella pneumoniae]|uniref:hypothetical protein n=1 Tax=Klebsiella pneumoniae TaxID=573 RepID=UPI0037C42EBC
MTKSTITRERIQRIIRAINSEAYDEEEIREWLSSDEIMELSRMALAAMDSEPVTVPEHITYISEPTILNILANDDSSPMAYAARLLAYEVRFWRSFPLYRHPQPAPVVPEEWAIADAVNFCKETGRQDAGAAMDAWNACRAAMLNGGKS